MRDLLSKLDAILAEETTLQDLKSHPAANDPTIQKAIAEKEKEEKSWVKDPRDPESKIPAIFRKGKQSSRDVAKRSADELNKEIGKDVWKSARESRDGDIFTVGDAFDISLSEDFVLEATIVDILEDGVVVELDDTAINYLQENGLTFADVQLDESKKKGVDGKACWKGYRYAGKEKKADGSYKDKCVKVKEDLKSSRQIKLKYWDGYIGVENTSEGVIIYGEDILGGFVDQEGEPAEEGSFDFEYNLTTNQLIKVASPDTAGEYDQYYKNENIQKITVSDLIKDLKNEYGSTWEEISDELEGVSVERESSIPFAGKSAGHKEGPAGWLKGKDKRPARAGDLVGGEGFDNDIDEAEYQGREVPLGKPMKGDVKKSKVYVKNPQGRVVKVNFGDKKMKIKKSNPKRRKSFRARHKCHTAKDRTTARYWSCRSW